MVQYMVCTMEMGVERGKGSGKIVKDEGNFTYSHPRMKRLAPLAPGGGGNCICQ